MAAKTFNFKDAKASTSNFGSLQDAGTITAATTGTGWVADQKAIGQACILNYGVKITRTDAQWGTALQPDSASAPNNTAATGAGDCFRSENTLSGIFANANWTIKFGFRSVSAAYAGRLKLHIRVWKSTSATAASGNTELTSSTQVSAATSANLSTTADTTLTITWSPGASFTFTNEYLLIQVGIEVTAAGSANTQDVVFRVDSASGYAITTSDFTVTAPGSVAASGAGTFSPKGGAQVGFAGAGSTSFAAHENAASKINAAGVGSFSPAGVAAKRGSVGFSGAGTATVKSGAKVAFGGIGSIIFGTFAPGSVGFAGSGSFHAIQFEYATARQIPGSDMFVIAMANEAQIPGADYVNALVYSFLSASFAGSGSTDFHGNTTSGTVSGSVGFAGVGTLTAVAKALAAAHLTASGAGTFSPAGAEKAAASSSFAGVGTASFHGAEHAAASLTVAGSGSFSVVGSENAAAALTASGIGAFDPHGATTAQGEAVLTAHGTGAFTVLGAQNAPATLAAAGSGSFIVVGQEFAAAALAASGVGTFGPVGAEFAAGSVGFGGRGSFSPIGSGPPPTPAGRIPPLWSIGPKGIKTKIAVPSRTEPEEGDA